MNSYDYDQYNLGTKHNNDMFSIFSESDEKTNLLRLTVDGSPILLKIPLKKRKSRKQVKNLADRLEQS